MGHYTTIYGEITGFSEDSLELIKEDLMNFFTDVHWRPESGGTLEIDSYGKHYPEFVDPVFDKVAFCLDEGSYGELIISDEEGKAVIFFAGPSAKTTHGRWVEKPAKMLRPENPFEEAGKALYGFRLEERNGEQEYGHDLLGRARNDSEAREKAQEQAMHWYGDEDAETSREREYPEYYFFGGTIAVRIGQIYKTTKEEWFERQYQSALIDSEDALS